MILGLVLAVIGLLVLFFGIGITGGEMVVHPLLWLLPLLGAALLVTGILMALTVGAGSHETEQWIADKSLTDPLSKQWCCGPSDCHALDDGEVQEARGGWMIKTPVDKEPEFVPYSRALPVSPDGRYHRCVAFIGGKAQSRCFIVPPGAS